MLVIHLLSFLVETLDGTRVGVCIGGMIYASLITPLCMVCYNLLQLNTLQRRLKAYYMKHTRMI
jgi:hypothetical protein